jgi:tetratricopeptide (TPR) repeat protein
LVIFLASGIALSADGNTTGGLANEENVSFTKQITSRFYEERCGFETNLIKRIPAPQEYEAEVPPAGAKEVFYDSGDLKLKAWLLDKPADDDKHPAVVFAHGGFSFGGSGWEDGQEFIDHGFILMTPMLRGENGNPGNFEYFYGEVDDLLAAADYLANVSYVDSKRIFLCGHSVGGTLSILASMMPSRYRAMASFGGMPDTEYLIRHGGYSNPFDSTNRKEFELRSAIYYPESIITPLFLYVGDQGEGALSEFSDYFAKNARSIGKPCEFRAVKGDHWSSVAESVRLCRAEFENISAYEALANNRSRAYSLVLKGNDLFNLSKYDEAIKFFDEAIAADPASVTAWNAKGAALGMAGRYEEALVCFEKAIEIDVESDLAWENKGEALRAMGRIAESNSAMVKARQLANIW